MTNENVRLYPMDRLLKATLLRYIPNWVTPNQVTIIRFLMTPLVLWAVSQGIWITVLALFAVAAFTDVLDGALARTRKQITMWGTVADPVADKVLVGSVMLFFVAHRIDPLFAALLVSLEVLIILGAYLRFRRKGMYLSANIFGKIKMGLQALAILLLLFDQIYQFAWSVPAAIILFGIALVLALISFLTYSL